jgi:hypothetical protein
MRKFRRLGVMELRSMNSTLCARNKVAQELDTDNRMKGCSDAFDKILQQFRYMLNLKMVVVHRILKTKVALDLSRLF